MQIIFQELQKVQEVIEEKTKKIILQTVERLVKFY